jgi:hypothetical protein
MRLAGRPWLSTDASSAALPRPARRAIRRVSLVSGLLLNRQSFCTPEERCLEPSSTRS